VFCALGEVDELNASIGLAREYCALSPDTQAMSHMLEEIQCRLMDVGSHLATPRSEEPQKADAPKLQRTMVEESWVARLEGWIDEMDKELPPLKNFILPSGGVESAALHLARTVCRRAERSVVGLVRSGAADAPAQRFLNRLSDFLFVAARYCCAKKGHVERVYQKAE